MEWTQFVQSAFNCVRSVLFGLDNVPYRKHPDTTRVPVQPPTIVKDIRVLPVNTTSITTCKPCIYNPSMSDHTGVSKNNIFIGNENVIVANGSARFNGENSRLFIGEFPNLEPSSTLVIPIRYPPDNELDSVKAPQTITVISNLLYWWRFLHRTLGNS